MIKSEEKGLLYETFIYMNLIVTTKQKSTTETHNKERQNRGEKILENNQTKIEDRHKGR